MKSNIKGRFMKYLSLLGLILLVGCSSRYYIYNTVTSEQFEVYICYVVDGKLRYLILDGSELVETLATHLVCRRISE